jgi:hypothetical protein
MDTEIKAGDDVAFRIIPGYEFAPAKVVSLNEETLVLRSYGRLPEDLTIGRFVVIPESPYTDFENYAEIVDIQNDLLYLKRRYTGKRAFFWLADELPVVARRIVGEVRAERPRIIMAGSQPALPDQPDESINPYIWSILESIRATQEFMMEKMYLEFGGLMSATRRPVSISGSGIKLTSEERMEKGDTAAIKIWLPMQRPVVVVVNGEVEESTMTTDGRCEITFRFMSMEDQVQDVLNQYTFIRQRELNKT